MGGLRRLTESECRARLAQHRTGRVAVVAPAAPHVIPVNHALVDEHVFLRTSPTTLLAGSSVGESVPDRDLLTDGPSRWGRLDVERGPFGSDPGGREPQG